MFLRLVLIGMVSMSVIACGADHEEFEGGDAYSEDAIGTLTASTRTPQPFMRSRPIGSTTKRITVPNRAVAPQVNTSPFRTQLATMQWMVRAHQPLVKQVVRLGHWLEKTATPQVISGQVTNAITRAWRHSGKVLNICGSQYGIDATSVECCNHREPLDLSLLLLLPNLKELRLYGVQVTSWEPLSQLTELQSLEILCENPQRDLHWPHTELLGECEEPHATSRPTPADIAQLTNLEKLTMDAWLGEGAEDIDLRPMRTLSKLQHLSLNSYDMHDIEEETAGESGRFPKLYGLGVLRQLKALKLVAVTVADQSVRLPRLTALTLSAPNATTAEIVARSNPQLRQLDMQGAKAEAVDSALRHLKQLRSLDLTVSGIKTLTDVSRNRQLKTLNIGSTDICSLAPIKKLKALQSLTADSLCRADKELVDFSPIQHLSNLKSLNVSMNRIDSYRWLRGLKLHTLNLSDSKAIDLRHLLPLRYHLKNLDITGYDMTLSHFSDLPKFKKLRKLSISSQRLYYCSCHGESDGTEIRTVGRLKHLKMLTVDDELPCHQLEEESEDDDETIEGSCFRRHCQAFSRLEKRGISVESTFEEPGC